MQPKWLHNNIQLHSHKCADAIQANHTTTLINKADNKVGMLKVQSIVNCSGPSNQLVCAHESLHVCLIQQLQQPKCFLLLFVVRLA